MSSSEQAQTIQYETNPIIEAAPKVAGISILTEATLSREINVNEAEYIGICMYAEPMWLGYLATHYILDVPPHIEELHGDDDAHIGYVISKADFEGLDCGDNSEFVIASTSNLLSGCIISRQNQITGVTENDIFPRTDIARRFGIVDGGFDHEMDGVNTGRIAFAIELAAAAREQMIKDGYRTEVQLTDFRAIWAALIEWTVAKNDMQDAIQACLAQAQ